MPEALPIRETAPQEEQEPLHTADVLQSIERLVKKKRQQIHNLSEYGDMDTAKNIQDLRSLVARFGYRLLAQSVGMVRQVGDGVALVSGLHGVMVNELVVFPDGTYGLAMDLDEHYVGCVLLSAGEGVQAGDVVYETGRVVDVPVGEALLGRVVNAIGQPIDDQGPLETDSRHPIEYPAPGFVQRTPIDQPLQTGTKAIDSIIPLGRGQRELIIGDRQTGKSAIAIDAVINQQDQGVKCVYVCIGQKMSTVAQIVQAFREHNALDYTVVVAASAEASPSMSYLAPYAGCAIAEHFMHKGQDVLIIYDDLSKHAVAYRQLSLLLERPAGREAYPGDVFYLHSRLLERSARLSKEYGGGSMTALPIVETQAGNISAYIPTNLISITDGQIYLSAKLFDEGVHPAIDIGLSVSRVGGAAQNDAMRAVSRNLALDVAQYLELRVFSRFGTELDPETRRQLARGERVRAVLTQPQFEPLPVAHQVAIIYAAAQGYLDDVPVDQALEFEAHFLQYLQRHYAGLLVEFAAGHWRQALEDDLQQALKRFQTRVMDWEEFTEPAGD